MTTTSKIEKQISDAINRSMMRNESTRLTVAATSEDVYAAVQMLWDGETDWTDDDGVMDIWGWTDDTPDGQQDWRLAVRFESE